MDLNLSLFFNSLFLGAGLSMDAFSVALVNGLRDSRMKLRKMLKISGVFAGFQALMPLLGWYFMRGLLNCFSAVRRYTPALSFILLLIVGAKMLLESGEKDRNDDELKAGTLFTQGIATSLDALAAGFTMGKQSFLQAFLSALIIASVTFLFCMTGLRIGKTAGEKLSSGASAAGGIILILLAFKIFFDGIS